MVEKYVLPEKCRADFVKENGVYRKLSTIERYCRRGYLSIVKGYSEEEHWKLVAVTSIVTII